MWKIQQYIQSMWNAGEEFNVAFWVFHDHMNLYYWMESGPVLSRRKKTIDCIVWERKGSFSVRFIVVLFYRHPMNVELRIIKSSRTFSVDSNLLSEIFYLHVSWFIFDCLPVGDKKGNQYRTDCNWEEHTRKKEMKTMFLFFAVCSFVGTVSSHPRGLPEVESTER